MNPTNQQIDQVNTSTLTNVGRGFLEALRYQNKIKANHRSELQSSDKLCKIFKK